MEAFDWGLYTFSLVEKHHTSNGRCHVGVNSYRTSMAASKDLSTSSYATGLV